MWEKRYTDDHEWVEIDADGVHGKYQPVHSSIDLSPPPPLSHANAGFCRETSGTIGISQFAANALGDVVFVELPTADLEVSAGDSIGAVESVKSASDIMTPVSGVVVEANSALEDKPATINKSPEGDGWLAKIKISDASEVDKLKTKEEYLKFTEEAEEH